jgi:hypothetical protein
MFELDTTMDDILINLRFMEQHIENPFNFCRAEAYAGTGLETKLKAQGRLLGDYFGLDYQIKDPQVEAFHQIANYAFFDRNFNDNGLHYFNMQVDFYFQLLRRFYPERLTQALRSVARNFIKRTNLDTYECLSQIYDFVMGPDLKERASIQDFAGEMRGQVDERSAGLRVQGERILDWLNEAYEGHAPDVRPAVVEFSPPAVPPSGVSAIPDEVLEAIGLAPDIGGKLLDELNLFGPVSAPVPYDDFKRQLVDE